MTASPKSEGQSLAREKARRRSVLGLLGAAAVVTAALVVGALGATGPGNRPAAAGTSRRTTTTVKTAARSGRPGTSTSDRPAKAARGHPGLPARKVFPGPFGMESSAIIAENNKPGTSAWQVSGKQAPGYIEGFATATYAKPGGTVALYVSTSAGSFRVSAYRMGWYHGKGGRLVWTSLSIKGRAQPACPVQPVTNMVSCTNWARSTVVAIGSSWVQGDYLLKLTGSGGQQAYVPLTVWGPTSHGTYLVMARSLTEQAWNPFGGFDLYEGEGPCAPGSASYPPCNRARVVSFDRPYAWGEGAADFLDNEYPFVRWAEQHGLDISYATDITVSEHPGIVLDHKALLSLDHDEVWTNSERLAALSAAKQGANMVFFGAAPVLRHARLQGSPLGLDREEVDYRDPSEDPLLGKASPYDVTGNTWGSPPTNWDEEMFVGEMYSGYLLPGAPSAAFVPFGNASWLFKGTGLRDGQAVPGVIASDIDHVTPSGPMPSDLEVVGHSPVPLAHAYTNQGAWDGYTYSDATYYTSASGSGVFDSGTVNWLTALVTCTRAACPAIPVSRITGNLLAVFGSGPAGRSHPSVANWRTVSPAGS